jgi:competence protein ComEC
MNIHSKKLLIIDNSGIYKNISYKADFVLLTQSPKINLQRLIEEFNPKMIIADGSNYKSYTLLWEKTSKKNNTKFHSTGEDGAFIVNSLR